MPRNVRNFWMSATCDGRDAGTTMGPIARDGGLSIHVQQRDRGEVTTGVTVECFATSDGALHLCVYDAAGAPVYRHTTAR